jgi:hypothetical protein
MLFAAVSLALLAQPAPRVASCAAPAPCAQRAAQPHPAVQDGAVLIGMGETMVVLLDENGGNPQLVVTGEEAAKRVLQPGELRFTMKPMMGTMLTVESQHGKWLNYRARVGLGGGPTTSVCTLMAGNSAFENWPQAFKGLTLDQFTPTDEGQMVCL